MGVEEKESSSFQGRVSIWNSNGSIVTAPTTLLPVFFLRDPSLIWNTDGLNCRQL